MDVDDVYILRGSVRIEKKNLGGKSMSKSDFEPILLGSEGRNIIKSQHMRNSQFTVGHRIYLSNFSLFVFLTVFPTETT